MSSEGRSRRRRHRVVVSYAQAKNYKKTRVKNRLVCCQEVFLSPRANPQLCECGVLVVVVFASLHMMPEPKLYIYILKKGVEKRLVVLPDILSVA